MSYNGYNYGYDYYGQQPPPPPPPPSQDLYGPTFVDPTYSSQPTIPTNPTTNTYNNTGGTTQDYYSNNQTAYNYPYSYGNTSATTPTSTTAQNTSSYYDSQNTATSTQTNVDPYNYNYPQTQHDHSPQYSPRYDSTATAYTQRHSGDYNSYYQTQQQQQTNQQQHSYDYSQQQQQQPQQTHSYDSQTQPQQQQSHYDYSQQHQRTPSVGQQATSYDNQYTTPTITTTPSASHDQSYQQQQQYNNSYANLQTTTNVTNNRHSQEFQYPAYNSTASSYSDLSQSSQTTTQNQQQQQQPQSSSSSSQTTQQQQQQLNDYYQSQEYQQYRQQQEKQQKEYEEQWKKYYEQQKEYEEQWRVYYEQQNQEMERIKQQQKEEQNRMQAQLEKEREEVERLKREAAKKLQEGEEEKQKVFLWQQEEMKRQMNELQKERELARKHDEEVRRAIMEEQKQQQQKLDEQQYFLSQQQETIAKKLQDEQNQRQMAEVQKNLEIKKQEELLQQKKLEIDSLVKKFENEKTHERTLAESRKGEVIKQQEEIERKNKELAKEREAVVALKQKQEQESQAIKIEFEKNRQLEEQKLKTQQDSIKREQELLDIQRKEIKIQAQQATIDSLQPMRDMVAALNINQKSPPTTAAPVLPKNAPARQAPLPPPSSGVVTIVAGNTAKPATATLVTATPAIPSTRPPSMIAKVEQQPRFPTINPDEIAQLNGKQYRLGDVVKIQRCFRKWSTRNKFRSLVAAKLHSNDPETENAKKRYRAVNEVYTTEVSYLNSLLVLQNFYFIPMEVEAKVTKLFKSEEIGKIFSNLKSLLQLSYDFHHELESRLNRFPIKVGDVFLKFAPIFKIYVEYVNNFDQVSPKLKVMMETPQGAQFFSEQKKKSRSNMDISSLLIMPVQRIPRYELLLREILSHTPQDHTEYKSIKTAHESMKGINQYINDRKKNVDNRSKLLELQKEIKNVPELLASHRYYVRDGSCVISSTKKNESGNFHLFFFNDIIVATKKSKLFSSYKFEYLFTIPLAGETDIKDIESKDSMVRIVYGNLSSIDVVIYTLCFPSKKEKDVWLSDLTNETSTKTGMKKLHSTASISEFIK